MLFLLMKISQIYETVKKNLRFYVTKCKESSKLKTGSKIYRVVNHSVNMGVVVIQVGNFLERSKFSRNFEQLVDYPLQHLWHSL